MKKKMVHNPTILSLLESILFKKILLFEEEQWKLQMAKKPKLRTYRLFKNKLRFEKYLTTAGFIKGKSLMFQLRSGTNKLEIERGRYLQLKPEERICNQCNLDVVEDEYHFTFIKK